MIGSNSSRAASSNRKPPAIPPNKPAAAPSTSELLFAGRPASSRPDRAAHIPVTTNAAPPTIRKPSANGINPARNTALVLRAQAAQCGTSNWMRTVCCPRPLRRGMFLTIPNRDVVSAAFAQETQRAGNFSSGEIPPGIGTL